MHTFEDLWLLYPKKEGKKYASECHKRLTAAAKRCAIAALPDHLRKWDIEGRTKQFMPDLSTWLNQARWDDEIEIEAKAVAWWATEDGVVSKGHEVGVSARPGEDMSAFKARVVEAMRRAA